MDRAELARRLGAPVALGETATGPHVIEEREPERFMAAFVAAVAAGGDVLFGTDVGYMRDFDPADEYALLASAGLSPMKILASLTSTPAARCRAAAAVTVASGGLPVAAWSA